MRRTLAEHTAVFLISLALAPFLAVGLPLVYFVAQAFYWLSPSGEQPEVLRVAYFQGTMSMSAGDIPTRSSAEQQLVHASPLKEEPLPVITTRPLWYEG